MDKILNSFKQNRQIWAWAFIVSAILILFVHAPVLPIVTGGLLAVVVSSLRALSYGQKKPWQVGPQR
jgi:hypothetical protein